MEDGEDEEQRDEEEGEEPEASLSPMSPLSFSSSASPADAVPRLASLLPLPQPVAPVALPLPSSYPIIQRFHFRSPRFRTAKRATFVLRAAGEPEAASPASLPTPVDGAKTPRKRKGREVKARSMSASPASSAALFSHLPPAVARQCAELCSGVWTEAAKSAARQLIDSTSSSRLRQAEQEKLNRAIQAEGRLLRLMEGEGGGEKRAKRGEEVKRKSKEFRSDRRTAGSVEAKPRREQLRGGPPTPQPGGRTDGDGEQQSEDGQGSSADGEGEVSSLRHSPSACADERAQLSPAMPRRPSRGRQAELRRRVFCPSPSACQSTFSSFLIHITQGPHDGDPASHSSHAGEQQQQQQQQQ